MGEWVGAQEQLAAYLLTLCRPSSPQLKVRDERLGEASELQKFLQNLDHFQQWLTRTQTTIASDDIPQVSDALTCCRVCVFICTSYTCTCKCSR